MLYALEHIIPPEGDLYNLDTISSEHRTIIKKAFNIALNSSNKRSAMLAINESRRHIDQETGIVSPKAKDILSAIEVKHPALIKYLCSGYGVYLQRLDSDLAEKILLDLLSESICVLCIHDSFIVNVEYEDKLYESMRNHFYTTFNFYPVIK